MKRQLLLASIAFLAMVPICLAQAEKNQKGKTPGVNRTSTFQETAAIDLEKSLWQAVKNKQYEAFRGHFAKDYRGVYSDGVKSLDEEIAGVHQTDLRDFALSDVRVLFTDKDAVTLTYKITVQGSSSGQDISGSYYTSSVWVKRGHKWLVVLHTETKAE